MWRPIVRYYIGLRESTGLAADIAGTKSTSKVLEEKSIQGTPSGPAGRIEVATAGSKKAETGSKFAPENMTRQNRLFGVPADFSKSQSIALRRLAQDADTNRLISSDGLTASCFRADIVSFCCVRYCLTAFRILDQEARIDAQRPADKAENHYGADPDAATATGVLRAPCSASI